MNVQSKISIKGIRRALLCIVAFAELMSLAPSAQAVPSYSRRYGEQCSTCHTTWGALSGAGVSFRLSGYRAIFGKDLTPVTEDQKISKGVTIPTSLPLSFITGVGLDSRNEKRQASGSATTNVSSGSSVHIEDASIFMTSPLGKHLSAFVEFPMYETKAWEFTPTGNAEANNPAIGRNVKFATEKPVFEVAKFFWNNLFDDAVPRDSVNLLAGITHLPLGYASGKVRLSVNQYLIYERTALSLISPRRFSDMGIEEPNDFLFRLGEPQGIAEVNGMLTFGKPVTDISKKETFWAEYHIGLTNGSNDSASNKNQKDLYGRWVMRYYGQSLGISGFRSADIYGDRLTRPDAAGMINLGPNSGIINPNWIGGSNKTTRWGPDMTISLVPYGMPLWLENEYMINSESNPTGYGREFAWKGGFSQLNWKAGKKDIVYARYDFLKGDPFNDMPFGGVTKSTPKEHDVLIGFQHLVDENIKFIGEYRHHEFEDNAGPAARLTDDGFTLRVMFGF
jgi:hypothetical protein